MSFGAFFVLHYYKCLSLAKGGLICRAGRDGIPCPCQFSEDVPSENFILNMRARKTPLSTIHFFVDVSGDAIIVYARVKFESFSSWGMSQAKRFFFCKKRRCEHLSS